MQDGKTIETRGREWLDLSIEQANNLFLINIDTVWTYYIEKCNFSLSEDEDCISDITNKDAALVIRDVANGVINIDRKLISMKLRNTYRNLDTTKKEMSIKNDRC